MDEEEEEEEEEIRPRSRKQGTAGGFDASQSGISDLIESSAGASSSATPEFSRERYLSFSS